MISISLMITSIGYFLETDEAKIMIIVGIFLWTIGFGLSVGPIVLLYIPEIV